MQQKFFRFFFCYLLFTNLTVFSQVGIGTSDPKPEALLDVESMEKAVLIPRINLTDLSLLSPITSSGSGTESLLVFNTNTITGKGFHYWNGADRWIPIGKANRGIQFYSFDLVTPVTSPDLTTLIQDNTVDKSGHYTGSLEVTNAAFPTSVLRPGSNNDGFIIKMIGFYTVKNSGVFNFSVTSNNGSRIYIDDSLVFDKWTDASSTGTGSITLQPGKYKFEFWYYENTGDQSFRFQWGSNPDALPIGTMQALQFTID